MTEDEDFLGPLAREVSLGLLKAGMDEAVGTEKGERMPTRRVCRSGYYVAGGAGWTSSSITFSAYTISLAVVAPTFSTTDCNYGTPQTVGIGKHHDMYERGVIVGTNPRFVTCLH